MFRNFLSSTPFVLCALMAPEGSGGGSSADTCPEPTGDTPELKHSSALSIIKDLWSKLTKATGDLKAANDLLGEGSQSSKDLKSEKDAHQITKDALTKAQSDLSTMTGDRDTQKSGKEKAEARVISVENFAKGKGLDLAGIDRAAAAKDVPEGGAADTTGQELWDKHQKMVADERAGKIEPGTAHAFFKKNQSALRAFAHTKRSRD